MINIPPLLPLKQKRDGETNKSGNDILKYPGWNNFKQTALDLEPFKGRFLRQFISEYLASEIIGLLYPYCGALLWLFWDCQLPPSGVTA
jgi:hypothetical protein